MSSWLARWVAAVAVLLAVGGCSSKTTNGGPYVFQGASDVASVARMTGCVPQVGLGVDPNGSVECNEGTVTWDGGGPDDPATIELAGGLTIDGASFEIQCDSPAWCEKARAALIAWVSPAKSK